MKNGKLNFFIKLLIFVIMVYSVVNIINLRTTYKSILQSESEMEQLRLEYLDEIDRLNEELEHEMDKDYIIRVAREKLNYHLPDEILFYSDR